MPSPNDLRKQATAKVAEAKAIQAKADTEKRELSDDEAKQIDVCLAEHERLDTEARDLDAKATKELERRNRLAQAEAYSKQGVGRISDDLPTITLPAQPRDKQVEDLNGFQSIGHYFQAVMAGDPTRGIGDRRLYATVGSDEANTQEGNRGGFLVPKAVQQALWDGAAQMPDNLLSQTDQYTLGTEESITFPAPDESTQAAGVAGGGITAAHRAELAQMSASRPSFREMTLKPEEIFVYVPVTDRLLASSALPLEQYLTRKAGEAIQSLISNDIISGTGAGQPLGILNSPCLVSITKETSQAAATVKFENVLKMWARFLASARSGATWYINQEVEPQLLQMVLGVGTSGFPVYMPAGGISGATYGTLFGRPVVPIASCKALGTKGDIILANMKWYASAVKGGLQSASSIHIRFDFAQTMFRFQVMVDGTPWLANPITPANATASATLSPFVTLNARS